MSHYVEIKRDVFGHVIRMITVDYREADIQDIYSDGDNDNDKGWRKLHTFRIYFVLNRNR